MNKTKYNYRNVTIEQIKEAFEKYSEKNKSTFNLPVGQIGNTEVYRIADNCLTDKAGWEMFQKELKNLTNTL